MINRIPKILLYSRLFFAFIILFIAFKPCLNSHIWVLILLYVGIISDVFDGIIARKLNISTEGFRLLDTIFDLFFYLSVLFYIYLNNQIAILSTYKLIFCILGLELGMYVISYLRFRKLPSPHAILSKFWGIYIVIEFTLLILKIDGRHFTIALLIGILVHIDRILIYIFLRKWDHDIPSCYHAYLIRTGREIKRNKLFNG